MVPPGYGVSPVLEVLSVMLASPELLETPAVLVVMAVLGGLDRLELRDREDPLEQPEPLDLLAVKVPPVRRARLGTKVLQEK